MKSQRKSSPTIEVRNLQRKERVNVGDLQRFAQKAAMRCLRLPKRTTSDLEKLPEISVLIISDRQMTTLHRRFMNKSGPTDVITFQHGEIFISVDTAVRNARRFGNSLGRELRLYIVHGLLHLHGFEDLDERTAREMRLAETKILGALS